jgi:hypothetical protein
MHVLREEGNRGGKRSKERKATEEGRGAKRGRQQRREEEQREEGNRGGKRSKERKATEEGRGARERTTTTGTPLLVFFSFLLRLINQLFQLTRNPKVFSVTLSTTGVLFFLSVLVLPTPERTWSSIAKQRICWFKCAPTS